jgi:hypothetical protein
MTEINSTEDLLEQFANAEGDERARLRELLEGRQRRPDPSEAGATGDEADKAASSTPLKLPTNGQLSKTSTGAVKLHFPRDGFLKAKSSNFDSAADLLRFVRATFGLKGSGSKLRASVRRTGKYQRLDADDNEVFTFGDPIIDSITDAHGWLTVGPDSFDLLPAALKEGSRGGVRGIDLSINSDRLRDRLVDEALSGRGTHTLVEHLADRTVVATTNPSEINQTSGGAHMRFKSWKTNYFFYRSIGSEIETWGRDFKSARIESMYADPVVGNDPFVCGITKVDSDSDTDDDYVDEYEVGIFANPAGSVRSVCTANWSGRAWAGTVQKGSCQLFIQ